MRTDIPFVRDAFENFRGGFCGNIFNKHFFVHAHLTLVILLSINFCLVAYTITDRSSCVKRQILEWLKWNA